MNNPKLTAALLVLAVIGYSLPWINGGSASLQPGALDFAEWLSLLPAVRINLPLLLPALFLRIALVMLGVLVALNIARTTWMWLKLLQIVILGGIFMALLPPIAFFAGQFDDTNYQQQAILWVGYCVLMLSIFFTRKRIPSQVLISVVSVLAVVFGAWGAIWGWQLLSAYQITLQIGLGGVIFSAALLTVAAQQVQDR